MTIYRTTLVYRRREAQPFRWLLAVVVFILSMCITFSEASGSTSGETTQVYVEAYFSPQFVSTASELSIEGITEEMESPHRAR